MCFAFPGKILKIEGTEALIDYESETRTAHLISDGFKEGDYVIVQGKIVLEKVRKEDAQKWLAMIHGRTG